MANTGPKKKGKTQAPPPQQQPGQRPSQQAPATAVTPSTQASAAAPPPQAPQAAGTPAQFDAAIVDPSTLSGASEPPPRADVPPAPRAEALATMYKCFSQSPALQEMDDPAFAMVRMCRQLLPLLVRATSLSASGAAPSSGSTSNGRGGGGGSSSSSAHVPPSMSREKAVRVTADLSLLLNTLAQWAEDSATLGMSMPPNALRELVDIRLMDHCVTFISSLPEPLTPVEWQQSGRSSAGGPTSLSVTEFELVKAAAMLLGIVHQVLKCASVYGRPVDTQAALLLPWLSPHALAAIDRLAHQSMTAALRAPALASIAEFVSGLLNCAFSHVSNLATVCRPPLPFAGPVFLAYERFLSSLADCHLLPFLRMQYPDDTVPVQSSPHGLSSSTSHDEFGSHLASVLSHLTHSQLGRIHEYAEVHTAEGRDRRPPWFHAADSEVFDTDLKTLVLSSISKVYQAWAGQLARNRPIFTNQYCVQRSDDRRSVQLHHMMSVLLLLTWSDPHERQDVKDEVVTMLVSMLSVFRTALMQVVASRQDLCWTSIEYALTIVAALLLDLPPARVTALRPRAARVATQMFAALRAINFVAMAPALPARAAAPLPPAGGNQQAASDSDLTKVTESLNQLLDSMDGHTAQITNCVSRCRILCLELVWLTMTGYAYPKAEGKRIPKGTSLTTVSREEAIATVSVIASAGLLGELDGALRSADVQDVHGHNMVIMGSQLLGLMFQISPSLISTVAGSASLVAFRKCVLRSTADAVPALLALAGQETLPLGPPPSQAATFGSETSLPSCAFPATAPGGGTAAPSASPATAAVADATAVAGTTVSEGLPVSATSQQQQPAAGGTASGGTAGGTSSGGTNISQGMASDGKEPVPASASMPAGVPSADPGCCSAGPSQGWQGGVVLSTGAQIVSLSGGARLEETSVAQLAAEMDEVGRRLTAVLLKMGQSVMTQQAADAAADGSGGGCSGDNASSRGRHSAAQLTTRAAQMQARLQQQRLEAAMASLQAMEISDEGARAAAGPAAAAEGGGGDGGAAQGTSNPGQASSSSTLSTQLQPAAGVLESERPAVPPASSGMSTDHGHAAPSRPDGNDGGAGGAAAQHGGSAAPPRAAAASAAAGVPPTAAASAAASAVPATLSRPLPERLYLEGSLQLLVVNMTSVLQAVLDSLYPMFDPDYAGNQFLPSGHIALPHQAATADLAPPISAEALPAARDQLVTQALLTTVHVLPIAVHNVKRCFTLLYALLDAGMTSAAASFRPAVLAASLVSSLQRLMMVDDARVVDVFDSLVISSGLDEMLMLLLDFAMQAPGTSLVGPSQPPQIGFWTAIDDAPDGGPPHHSLPDSSRNPPAAGGNSTSSAPATQALVSGDQPSSCPSLTERQRNAMPLSQDSTPDSTRANRWVYPGYKAVLVAGPDSSRGGTAGSSTTTTGAGGATAAASVDPSAPCPGGPPSMSSTFGPVLWENWNAVLICINLLMNSCPSPRLATRLAALGLAARLDDALTTLESSYAAAWTHPDTAGVPPAHGATAAVGGGIDVGGEGGDGAPMGLRPMLYINQDLPIHATARLLDLAMRGKACRIDYPKAFAQEQAARAAAQAQAQSSGSKSGAAAAAPAVASRTVGGHDGAADAAAAQGAASNAAFVGPSWSSTSSQGFAGPVRDGRHSAGKGDAVGMHAANAANVMIPTFSSAKHDGADGSAHVQRDSASTLQGGGGEVFVFKGGASGKQDPPGSVDASLQRSAGARTPFVQSHALVRHRDDAQPAAAAAPSATAADASAPLSQMDGDAGDATAVVGRRTAGASESTSLTRKAVRKGRSAAPIFSSVSSSSCATSAGYLHKGSNLATTPAAAATNMSLPFLFTATAPASASAAPSLFSNRVHLAAVAALSAASSRHKQGAADAALPMTGRHRSTCRPTDPSAKTITAPTSRDATGATAAGLQATDGTDAAATAASASAIPNSTGAVTAGVSNVAGGRKHAVATTPDTVAVGKKRAAHVADVDVLEGRCGGWPGDSDEAFAAAEALASAAAAVAAVPTAAAAAVAAPAPAQPCCSPGVTDATSSPDLRPMTLTAIKRSYVRLSEEMAKGVHSVNKSTLDAAMRRMWAVVCEGCAEPVPGPGSCWHAQEAHALLQGVMRRMADGEPTPDLLRPVPEPAEVMRLPHMMFCGNLLCGNLASHSEPGIPLRKCPCKLVAYCSAECQKACWGRHRWTCSARLGGRLMAGQGPAQDAHAASAGSTSQGRPH